MRSPVALLLAAITVAGCDATAPSLAGPVEVAVARPAIANTAPAELPHVVRSEAAFFFTIADFDQDLIVISGAPADSSKVIFCGGTEGPEPVPAQYVGDDEGPIKALSVARETYLRVYQPIGPSRGLFRRKLCLSTPIAQGYGTHLRTDNDLTGVGGRANSATEKMYGTLALATGGSVRLMATFHYTFLADGTLQQLKSTVDLTSIGRE